MAFSFPVGGNVYETRALQAMNAHKDVNLPLGYHFNPSDDQVLFLLRNFSRDDKAENAHQVFPFPIQFVPDVYETTPENLLAGRGCLDKCFFLCNRRFVPNSRSNRVVLGGGGYWKRTKGDVDRIEFGDEEGNVRRETFYSGKQGAGKKTNWLLEEFSIYDSTHKVDVVIAKITSTSVPAVEPSSTSVPVEPPSTSVPVEAPSTSVESVGSSSVPMDYTIQQKQLNPMDQDIDQPLFNFEIPTRFGLN